MRPPPLVFLALLAASCSRPEAPPATPESTEPAAAGATSGSESSGGSAGTFPDDEVTLGLTLRVDPTRANDSVKLVLLLPDDIPGAQEVLEVRSSHPWTERREGHHRYAVFQLSSLPWLWDTVVDLELDLRLWERDLAGLRAAGHAGAALAPEERKRYLAVEPRLEHDDRRVRALARRIPRGTDDLTLVRNTYRAVLEYLDYPGYLPKDQGVRRTVRSRSGDCTDYTDLLVSLLRARGVPARHLLGVMQDGGSADKHSWAEAWTEELGWIAVDPLLGDLGQVEFDDLRATYVAFSTERRDPVIGPYFYYRYWWEGGEVEVEMDIELR